MIKIVVDCFGGDHSPEANVAGSVSALYRFNDLYLILTGDEETIKKQNIKVQEEIDYINNYQLKYLDSDHAKNFLAHENNILKDGETVIDFQ